MDALARWRILRLHVEDDIPLATLVRETGIGLRTLQRWNHDYAVAGIDGLKPSARADAGTRRTDPDLVVDRHGIFGLDVGRSILEAEQVSRRHL